MSSNHELSTSLGYNFADRSLCKLALTHRSVSKNTNYERLEFLGDALLSGIIAKALYDKYPYEQEGKLTRMRATLVRQETLVKVAHELKVGKHLKLGAGELKAGGRKRESILADVVEALIGAMYLDCRSFDKVEQIVSMWFKNQLDEIETLPVLKDAKSRLQELLQSNGHALPVYTLDDIHGKAPNEVFFVTCSAASQKTQAKGKNRRIAEQNSAALMLKILS